MRSFLRAMIVVAVGLHACSVDNVLVHGGIVLMCYGN